MTRSWMARVLRPLYLSPRECLERPLTGPAGPVFHRPVARQGTYTWLYVNLRR